MLRIDKKRSMEVINDLYGAPSDILLSEEKFLEALEMYQQQQMMMTKVQVAKIEADVQAKNASANQQNAQAEATVGGMNGMINGGGAGYASMIS